MRDDADNVISDQSNILKNIHKFYSKLYSNQGLSEFPDEELFNSVVTPKLTDDERSILDQPLSKQELYDVNKTMKTNKTPGFDGLPIAFYVVFFTRYL